MMKRLVANLATNFQDLVAKVKNLVALAPVLGAISHPVIVIVWIWKFSLFLFLNRKLYVNVRQSTYIYMLWQRANTQ